NAADIHEGHGDVRRHIPGQENLFARREPFEAVQDRRLIFPEELRRGPAASHVELFDPAPSDGGGLSRLPEALDEPFEAQHAIVGACSSTRCRPGARPAPIAHWPAEPAEARTRTRTGRGGPD